jgi:hypothetical protein
VDSTIGVRGDRRSIAGIRYKEPAARSSWTALQQGSSGLGQRINEVYFDKEFVTPPARRKGGADRPYPRAGSAGPGAFFPRASLPTGDVTLQDMTAWRRRRPELLSRMLEEGFFQVEALPSSGGNSACIGNVPSQQEAEAKAPSLSGTGVPSVGEVKRGAQRSK